MATEPERGGSGEPDLLAGLAAAAAEGDATATRVLFEALAPRMLGVARGVLGASHPDVDDAAQEALVAVLRALPGFRGECTVLHYATRIGVRCCMALRKRDKRGRLIEERAALDREDDDAVAPAAEPVVSARRRGEIRELLATLPEAQAETLGLRIVMGLSMQEVASTTGVPLNTVRSRLRLAKEALRKKIEADPALAELLEVRS